MVVFSLPLSLPFFFFMTLSCFFFVPIVYLFFLSRFSFHFLCPKASFVFSSPGSSSFPFFFRYTFHLSYFQVKLPRHSHCRLPSMTFKNDSSFPLFFFAPPRSFSFSLLLVSNQLMHQWTNVSCFESIHPLR